MAGEDRSVGHSRLVGQKSIFMSCDFGQFNLLTKYRPLGVP